MQVTRTTTWTSGQTLTASALNNEFNNLLNAPNIVNADISASAAIAYSKLNLSLSVKDADIATNAAITASKIANTAVTLSDTQTLTNKTLTNPTVNGSIQNVTSISGTTPTLDLSTANVFNGQLSGNTTFSLSNVLAGKVFVLEIQQGSGTSYTTTFWSNITWVTAGGTAPTQTTVSNGWTIYWFRALTTTTFLGGLVSTE